MKLKILVDKARPKSQEKKQKKEIILDNLCNYFKAREMVINGFKSKIFLIKSEGSGILNTKFKILTPKQMLQTLSTALAQIKAGNQKIY